MKPVQPLKRETAVEPIRMTPREFDEIYDRYRGDVFRFLFSLTRNQAEAEDMFQEVWLRVVRHGPARPQREDLRPWLLTIVLNLHRDMLRKKRVRRLFLVRRYGEEQSSSRRPDGPVLQATDPAQLNEQAVLQRDIDRAVAALPEKQRRVFLLSEVEDLPLAEIAAVLKVPLGTVKSLLHRALKRLQGKLAAHHPNRERIKCVAKMLSV
ncbi:MAG: RNA polymerase sigma factor [Candidatus Aminicenantales bacterium]